MFQYTTEIAPKSNNVIDDTDYESPAIEPGSTMFWQDDNHDWQTVEVIECEPVGWGFCTIKWHTLGGWHTKSLPFTALCDLDTYLDQQGDYGQFEASDIEYDDWKDSRALHRWAHGQ